MNTINIRRTVLAAVEIYGRTTHRIVPSEVVGQIMVSDKIKRVLGEMDIMVGRCSRNGAREVSGVVGELVIPLFKHVVIMEKTLISPKRYARTTAVRHFQEGEFVLEFVRFPGPDEREYGRGADRVSSNYSGNIVWDRAFSYTSGKCDTADNLMEEMVIEAVKLVEKLEKPKTTPPTPKNITVVAKPGQTVTVVCEEVDKCRGCMGSYHECLEFCAYPKEQPQTWEEKIVSYVEKTGAVTDKQISDALLPGASMSDLVCVKVLLRRAVQNGLLVMSKKAVGPNGQFLYMAV